jgi:3-deoxy-D-manno-octulosonic-acid transferase
MWYLIYNLLLILASPVIFLILLAKKRCRRGLPQRLGFYSSDVVEPTSKAAVLWIHAVSLGEVVAVVPLVQALHLRYPGFRIVVSTVTETGREAVEQRLAGVARHCYAPLDFAWAISRAIETLKPSVFLFVETELWPNLLRALSRRHIPAVLINGRLSSRSFRGYLALRWFFADVLSHVTLCLAQSERDAQRLIDLGADPARVVRTGNLKFDQLPEAGAVASPDRSELGLAEHEMLLVAGSTHPGEEEQILTCYSRVQAAYGSLVLLLAPRHIERVPSLEATVRQHGWPVVLRSRMSGTKDVVRGPRVIILDTRGELAAIYRHSLVSFVGGTLVPVGGHNVLEPAVWGKPVFFGPYTDHCEELADLLLQAGGAIRIRNGQELAGEIARLLNNRSAVQAMGDSARRVVQENRGAVQRSLRLLEPVLLSPSPAPHQHTLQSISHQVVR